MKSILVSFLAGVVAGILIAPDKGVNTRNKISSAAKWLPQKVDEKFNEVTSKIENTAEAVDEKLQRFGGVEG